MPLRQLEIRPAPAKLIQQRNRFGKPSAAENGAGLAEDIFGFIPHRLDENQVVVILGFAVSLARETLLRQRGAIGDGVGKFDLILERAIDLVRVQRPADGFARLLALAGSEPCRDQLHRYISKRADSRQHQNDIAPRREAPAFGSVHDQHDVDEGEKQNNRH